MDGVEIRAESAEPPVGKTGRHVVLLIHGIRTVGFWRHAARDVLDQIPGLVALPVGYDWLDTVRFWLPFGTRERPVRTVLAQLRDAQRRFGHDRLSIVAHSFGTYITLRLLVDHDDIDVERLVLCGSIAPRAFRWSRLRSRVGLCLNECGTRDIWPILAEKTSWGYGASGTFGFAAGTALVEDHFHRLGHSDFFDPARGFVERRWAPFLKDGALPERPPPATPSDYPGWLRLLAVLPIKVLAILSLLLWVWLAGSSGETSRRASPGPPEVSDVPERNLSTAGGPHRDPALSADGARLAFVGDVDGEPGLWVRAVDGTQVRPLMRGPGSFSPAWSPDGRGLLFDREEPRGRSIWSVAADGRAARRVLEDGLHPAWFPDGERFAFERSGEIWVARLDGSEARRVEGVDVPQPLLHDRQPAVSPDGLWIAYFQNSKGPMGDLWVVPAAGGTARRLTRDDGFGGEPVWLPDGSGLLYSSDRGGERTLWRVPIDGGVPTPVLRGGDRTDPSLSRDGRRLAYVDTRKREVLTIWSPATGEHRTVHRTRGLLVDPELSPDGKRIAFFGSDGFGGVRVFTVNRDGTALRRVTGAPLTRDLHPQWSADGESIFYYASPRQVPGAPPAAYRRADLDDGTDHPVVAGWEWATENGADLSPDGHRLLYTRWRQGAPRETMILDLRTGVETRHHRLLAKAVWSRDGREIIGVDLGSSGWNGVSGGTITICPVTRGPCRPLTLGLLPLAAPDGEHVYFLLTTERRDRRELWRIDLDGSGEEKIGDLEPIDPDDPFYDVTAEGEVVFDRLEEGEPEIRLVELAWGRRPKHPE